MTDNPAATTVATIAVDGRRLAIEQSTYTATGCVALLAYNAVNGEFYGDISVNLPGHLPSSPARFFVKDTTATSALGVVLRRNSIIQPTGRTATYGNFNSTAAEFEITTAL
ncbi:hypothetical protein ACT3SZ_15065 [Corynebacterium sp. AOP40-9SA-29]|uniref:hypothetical protein n=1 Tax=Corynebacterium sp. AOP40-9SA-29 TaxID=3457677 RepID=UPI0040335BF3